MWLGCHDGCSCQSIEAGAEPAGKQPTSDDLYSYCQPHTTLICSHFKVLPVCCSNLHVFDFIKVPAFIFCRGIINRMAKLSQLDLAL